ncbi:hypothetical protein [Streptomyces litmocidini]|uniref:hypothetical protein n=1 Tax=Streptomyces litmocidini TaxID=67318 RepID=UPI0037010488
MDGGRRRRRRPRTLPAVGATAAPAGSAPVHEGTSVAVTVRSPGLGAEEELVVKDVIRDADGAVHTRHDRTYTGLPVLGGDLIAHQAADADDTWGTAPPPTTRPPPWTPSGRR